MIKKLSNLQKKRAITNTNFNQTNEELNFSEIKSLPIKINLKINKKPKENIAQNKKQIPIERKNIGEKNTKIKKVKNYLIKKIKIKQS